VSTYQNITLFASEKQRIIIGLQRDSDKEKWKLFVYPEDEGRTYSAYEPITRKALLQMMTRIMDLLTRQDIP
jgi:hypothetical protein